MIKQYRALPRSLHPSPTNLYRRHHHSLSEQDAPSRSAFNALIG
jgi:hypothetical protein